MSAAISIDQLSKAYGATRAVVDLTLTVESGEFLGFLGPNGAGKTTTIRVLTGIIRADSGRVEVAGLTLDRREAVARIIGVVPESRGFYDWMTAAEYLRFFAGLYGIHGSGQSSIVDSLLEQVGLAGGRHTLIGTFSRGMKQRLGLARALVNQPQILFLDEPTLGLDPQGQQDVKNLLRKLNAEGVTVFLSSHLLPEVADLCSRVAIIDQGRLVAEGSMDELRQKAGLKPGWYVRVVGDISLLESTALSPRVVDRKDGPDQAEFLFQGNQTEANSLLDQLRARHLEVLKFTPGGQDLEGIFMALTRPQREGTTPGPSDLLTRGAADHHDGHTGDAGGTK